MKSVSKKKLIKLSILLIFAANIKAQARVMTQNEILVLGGAAVTGLVAYSINSYYNSIYYLKGIVEDANLVARRIVNYESQIQILEKAFYLSEMTEFEKRSAASKITEDLVFELAPVINSYGVGCYLNNLSDLIYKIKLNEKSVNNTIEKLRQKQNIGSLYADARRLSEYFQRLLPKLEFLYLYVSTHRSYFKLMDVYNNVSQTFKIERLSMTQININSVSIEEFKKFIRQKNFNKESKYILLNYVERLTENIESIEKHISCLDFRYPKLIRDVIELKYRLIEIRDTIVIDQEYITEKRLFQEDEERKERIRIQQALKAKQLALEAQRLREEKELRERELAAREREVKARELEALAKVNQALNPAPAVQPQVHVHINNNREVVEPA